MYGFWQMVSRFPIGIIADRMGWRKPLTIAMLVLLAGGSLALGMGSDFWGLTVGRSMIGFAAAAWVLLIVLYTSEVEPGKLVQSTAQMTIVFAIGRVSASLVSPWLVATFGQISPFWFSAGAALLAALILAFTPLRKMPKVVVSYQSVKKVVLQAGVIIPSLISIILHYADWSATFSFIPVQAKVFGATSSTLAFLVILELLIIIPVNSLTPKLAQKIGKIPVIAISIGVQALALFLIFLAKDMAWLWISQGLLGVGYGLAYPILLGMTMECTRPEEHSIATGFHQSVYALGMFAGPYISGLIATAVGVQPGFAVTGCIVLLSGSTSILALKRKSSNTSPEIT
jgi:MFS family permease